MKITCVSDTHGRPWVDDIKPCDILLHCGDISPVDMSHTFYAQQVWFYEEFLPSLETLKDRVGHIVFIAGNHDTFLYQQFLSKTAPPVLPAGTQNITYLCNSEVTINGVRIYGTPWCNLPSWASPGGPVWNFAEQDEQLYYRFKHIPEDLDILITHGPAHSACDVILDLSRNGDSGRLGSTSLACAIRGKKNGPKYVFSGHIHSADHNAFRSGGTEFRCVSLLDENYKKYYSPHTLDLGAAHVV